MFGRKSKDPLISSACWLCRIWCHQRAGTNSVKRDRIGDAVKSLEKLRSRAAAPGR